MTTAYHALLKNPRWFLKRKSILTRDGYKCRNCGDTNALHVHHRQYHVVRSTGEFKLPWKYKDSFLITLCYKCHQAGHSKYKVPAFTT